MIKTFFFKDSKKKNNKYQQKLLSSKYWQPCLEFQLMANDFNDNEKKRAIFLSVCGASFYSMLCALCKPDTLKMVGSDDILEKLENFSPQPSKT